MRYPPAFRVRTPLADIARFDASTASLKASMPPLVLSQLGEAPEQMEEGDEMNITMWLEPLLLGFRAWGTRRLLEGASR